MAPEFITKEKILVHLLECYDSESQYAQPPEITQEGIAEEIGAKQNTVSYAVRDLQDEGMVSEETCRIKGKKQRRKGYFLTEKGVEKAKKTKQEILNTPVDVSVDGKTKNLKIRDINRYFRTSYSLTEILKKLDEDSLELESREKKDVQVSYDYMMPSFLPEELTDISTDEIEGWWSKDEKLLILKGEEGVGKTTKLVQFTDEKSDEITLFYLPLKDWYEERHVWDYLADFLTICGEHRLSSYLEANQIIDRHECLINFERDMEYLSSSLIIIEDVDQNYELRDVLLQLGDRLLDIEGARGIFTTSDQLDWDLLSRDETSSLELEREELPLIRESKEYYELASDEEHSIDVVLDTKLTYQEKGILAYSSIFRRPVEKKELSRVEGANKKIVDNLSRTPLITTNKKGRLYLHPVIQRKVSERVNSTKELHENAYTYYSSASIKSREDTIELLYHLSRTDYMDKIEENLKKYSDGIISAGYTKSLFRILDHLEEKRDTEEIVDTIYRLKGKTNNVLGRLDQALEKYEKLIDITDDPDDMIVGKMGIAEINAEQGQYEEGIKNYEEAIDLAKEWGEKGRIKMGKTYIKLADLLDTVGDYEEAEEQINNALEVLEDREEYPLLTNAHFLLTRLKKGKGEWEESLDHFKRGLECWKQIEEPQKKVGGFQEIGKFYKGLRKLDNAKEFLSETIETCERFGYRKLKGSALLTLAECDLESRDYDRAIESAEEAKDIFDSLNREKDKAYAHALLGQAYIKMDDKDKAEEQLTMAISIYQRLGSSYPLGLTYFSMAKLQEKRGNKDGIADNYRKALLSFSSTGANEMAKKVEKKMKNVPLSM